MARTRPNVLLICVDALRSDFGVGEHGTDKPFLETLGRAGVTFDTMIAAASSTTPCVASFMTGNYPPDHGVLSLRDFALNDDTTTLAEVFDAAGYETGAHVCGPITADTGLDAGFDTYEHRESDRTVYTDWYTDLLSDIEGASEPWFRYLHLWEAHIPRTLPPDAADDELPYDASLRGLSERLSALLERVDLDRTVVAVTGDHGESIRDGTFRNWATVIGLRQIPIPFTGMRTKHVRQRVYDDFLRPNGIELEEYYNAARRFGGAEFPTALHRWGHGYHVYDFLVEVPFVLAGPGIPTGERVETQVRQVDIYPTLLSAAGLDPSDAVAGQDLLDGDVAEHPAHARAVAAFDSEEKWLDGVRYDGWKFVTGRGRELRQLFDVESDPHEVHNVVDDHPKVATRLETMVDEMVAREGTTGSGSIPDDADERMTRRLEDLGYL